MISKINWTNQSTKFFFNKNLKIYKMNCDIKYKFLFFKKQIWKVTFTKVIYY